jgi:molybdopterin molybdotransferase
VIIQENVRRATEIATIDADPGRARHIRERGSDFEAGEELLGVGRELDPRAIVAAAAADVGEVAVYRRPRLHVLSTGDELAEPGTAREQADAIPDSVSFGVAALAAEWASECIHRTCLRDDLPAMQSVAAATVGAADIIVVTGGASVGEKDFAKTMFEPLGLELVFSKIAIKPGKPVWLARLRDTLVMGLPGNPTSAMVTARLFLAPLLGAMRGQPIEAVLDWRGAPLASPLSECGERETFHRGRWKDGAIDILSYQDSGAQKALADADLLVRQRPNSPALQAGDAVNVLDF